MLLISIFGNSVVLDVSFKFLSSGGPLTYYQGNSLVKKTASLYKVKIFRNHKDIHTNTEFHHFR